MKPQQKTLTLWVVVLLMMALIAKVAVEDKTTYKRITYPEFIQAVESNHVTEVTFKGDKRILGKFSDGYEQGQRFTLAGTTGQETFEILKKHGIYPEYQEEEKHLMAIHLS